MKRIQAILIISLSLFTGAGQLSAAPGSGPGVSGKPGERAAEMLQKLQQELALTPEQVEKIKKLGEAERKKMAEMRGDAALTREQKMQVMKAARDRMDAGIREVLTPEQQTKFDQLVAERKAKGPGEKKKKQNPAG